MLYALCLSLLAAGLAKGLFSNAPESAFTPMGVTISGNALSATALPANESATIERFSVGSGGQGYAPGAGPVTLTAPGTGRAVGTLAVHADGNYTFAPTPGYVGPVPFIVLHSRSSDGQTAISALTLEVTYRKFPEWPK